MNIKEIAEKLNELSHKYQMNNFQQIRKQIHKFSKITYPKIFSSKTISENQDDIYAFHHGGRSEIQYNIGYEKEKKIFRYGLAFSLESSVSLKEPVTVLASKIERFNEYIKLNPGKYSDMHMWHYQNRKRSKNRKITTISKSLIKNKNFIFIGEYFDKQVEDVTQEDLEEVLKTFDRLLDLYKYVEEAIIEEKIARICWNGCGWQRPSGHKGKSKNKNSYEHKVGYGHEEWLFDFEKFINGYHYGYLQPVADGWPKNQGMVFNISLYSIKNDTSEWWWIGTINNAQVVSPEESRVVYTYYKKEGWFQEMIEQIRDVKGIEKDFLENARQAFVNVKFRRENWNPVDPPQKILNTKDVIPATYYKLLNKIKDPHLELPFGEDPSFSPGHTLRKERSTAHYGQRKSEIDRFEDKMLNNSYKQLVKIYGYANVRTERPIGIGSRVDLVVRDKDGEIFFELKTNNSIRACIRDALSQLLEYSYYPDKERARKLIIVSQNSINEEAKNYLNKIREKFKIPVYYRRYNVSTNCLEDAEY